MQIDNYNESLFRDPPSPKDLQYERNPSQDRHDAVEHKHSAQVLEIDLSPLGL